MKLSKFLLISTLIAFTLAIITLPVVAKPSIKSHFVHLQHTQPSQTEHIKMSLAYEAVMRITFTLKTYQSCS